jgi:hypothetical protein
MVMMMMMMMVRQRRGRRRERSREKKNHLSLSLIPLSFPFSLFRSFGHEGTSKRSRERSKYFHTSLPVDDLDRNNNNNHRNRNRNTITTATSPFGRESTPLMSSTTTTTSSSSSATAAAPAAAHRITNDSAVLSQIQSLFSDYLLRNDFVDPQDLLSLSHADVAGEKSFNVTQKLFLFKLLKQQQQQQ